MGKVQTWACSFGFPCPARHLKIPGTRALFAEADVATAACMAGRGSLLQGSADVVSGGCLRVYRAVAKILA